MNSFNPLPDLHQKSICRKFEIFQTNNVDVTALDISSHGAYVVAGCGNGTILCYDMTSSFQNCGVVGQFRAKGLHTNLLLTLKITDDCRFCFAGVLKGSSEMLAIDMGKLSLLDGRSDGKYGAHQIVEDVVVTYSHQDAKLRGFGAAARVDKSSLKSEYRLVCGRGIKNVHVWQFIAPEESPTSNGQPFWSCIYDVATNGNTIECMQFRMGGQQLISKSAGANLRVWDLSNYESDPTGKPPFEDIQNTQDARVIEDGYAFGGTYEFAVINLSAPRAANRDALEMPGLSTEDDQGQRRKRMMRQIDEVLATRDARHCLILCTDGGILYFRNDHTNGEGIPAGHNSLIELQSLQRDLERDQTWHAKRVGRRGDVVLLRARKSAPSSSSRESTKTTIWVQFLSDVVRGEIGGTGVPADEIETWHTGYFNVDAAVGESMTLQFPESQAAPDCDSMASSLSLSQEMGGNVPLSSSSSSLWPKVGGMQGQALGRPPRVPSVDGIAQKKGLSATALDDGGKKNAADQLVDSMMADHFLAVPSSSLVPTTMAMTPLSTPRSSSSSSSSSSSTSSTSSVSSADADVASRIQHQQQRERSSIAQFTAHADASSSKGLNNDKQSPNSVTLVDDFLSADSGSKQAMVDSLVPTIGSSSPSTSSSPSPLLASSAGAHKARSRVSNERGASASTIALKRSLAKEDKDKDKDKDKDRSPTEDADASEGKKQRRVLYLPAPVAPRVVKESNIVHPMMPTPPSIAAHQQAVEEMIAAWRNETKASMARAPVVSIEALSASGEGTWSTAARSALVGINTEQDRLCVQFVQEVIKAVRALIVAAVALVGREDDSNCSARPSSAIPELCATYQGHVAAALTRQREEIMGALRRAAIADSHAPPHSHSSPRAHCVSVPLIPPLTFKHVCVFESAMVLDTRMTERVQHLLAS